MSNKKSNVKSVKMKPVKLKLGENEYNFILDLNAFSELEDDFGSIGELMMRVESGSIKALRAVIWAGLLNNENAPSLKEVGSNIQISQLDELSRMIAEGMGVALPESEEIDPN
jgi:hypothetical protein